MKQIILISVVLKCVLGLAYPQDLNGYHPAYVNSVRRTDKFSPAVKKDGLVVVAALHVKTSTKTYYVQTFDHQMNWFRAMQFCKFQGMELASINSEEEYETLTEALVQTYPMEIHFWTSGNDLAQKRDYFWMATGSSFPNSLAWAPGEPSHLIHSGEEERCVELMNAHGTFLFNDHLCSFEAQIICEK